MKAQKKHMKRNNQSKYVKKQNMKQAGITLIALVVTFIVFLVNIRNVDFAIGCEYL